MTDTLPAVIKSGGTVAAFIPTDLDQIWRMARMAVMGKMAPKSLVEGKDPDEATSACAIAIMAGAELGLTPLMSLRSYAVVNGRPSLWGDGIKAVVRKSGLCEYIRTGHNEIGGWCEAKRKDTGEDKREEFTFAQAAAAGLMKKTGPWSAGYADIMAERRATFRCLNDLFADVLGGLANTEEAMEDGPIVDVTSPPSRPTPPSPPAEDEPDPSAPPDQKDGGGTGEPEKTGSAPAANPPAQVAQMDAGGEPGAATSGVTSMSDSPKHIVADPDDIDDDTRLTDKPAMPKESYFLRLDEELSELSTEDEVIAHYENMGIDAALEGNDAALDRAAAVRNRHLARVNGQGDLLAERPFPGDTRP